MTTAHDIAKGPELYNKKVRFRYRSNITWECMGYNKKLTKILFARLVAQKYPHLRQINKWVSPDTEIFI